MATDEDVPRGHCDVQNVENNRCFSIISNLYQIQLTVYERELNLAFLTSRHTSSHETSGGFAVYLCFFVFSVSERQLPEQMSSEASDQ